MNTCCIAMPTRNRPDFLRDSLSRLRTVGLGHLPLFVYDDASDDPAAVAAAVRDTWTDAPATVVPGDRQRGQCHGRNVLLRQCGCAFAILLDDDQYLTDLGDLHAFLDPARRDPHLAGVAFQSRDKHDGRLDFPADLDARRTPFFMGGSVLLHVPTFLEVGGYREFWGYGYEEPELACRYYARGFHLLYNPRIQVEHNHVVQPHARRNERQYHRLYARNALLLSSMNMPLWWGLPIGMVRSLRRSRTTPGYWPTKLAGLGDGLWITLRHWRDRTPMSLAQSRAWMHFNRHWMRTPPP